MQKVAGNLMPRLTGANSGTLSLTTVVQKYIPRDEYD